MPIYRVNIDRPVTTWDRFTRYVRADTPEEAESIGAAMAVQANDEEPDDTYGGLFDPEPGAFAVNDVEEADPIDLNTAEDCQIAYEDEED